MIDIHSHILPGVDDGSQDLEESIRMARLAVENGTEWIAATPHFNLPDIWQDPADLKRAYQLLKDELDIQKIPLKVRLGMEIFATENTAELLKAGKLWGYEGTDYVLIEFDFDENPDLVFLILEEVQEAGFRPIVAHPERYRFIQRDPEMVYEWRLNGFGTQVNKSSVLGRFGRGAEETAHEMLRRDLVTMIASDAHSSEIRTPDMREAWEMLVQEYSLELADRLMNVNPARVLRGEPFEPGNPGSFFETYRR